MENSTASRRMLVAGPWRSTPMVHGPTPPTYSLLPIPVLLSDNGRMQIAKQQMLPDEGDHTTEKGPMAACQRSIVSCSRCRKRKIKCDRQLPSCSQCIRSRSSCIGISPSAQEIPRSIVQNLENEIARLESRMSVGGSVNTLPETLSPAQAPSQPKQTENSAFPIRDSLRASITSSRFMHDMVATTRPCASTTPDLLFKVKLGMTPSSSEICIGVDHTATKSGKGHSYLDAGVLRSIPSDVLQRMIGKYITKIHCHNPFLDVKALWRHLDYAVQVLNSNDSLQTGIIPSYEFLVIYLVLATSITLEAADGQHGARRMTLSTALFEEGIRHFYSLNTFPSDVAWIQTVLLILFYATISPRSANVWILSGAAMRACAQLGLHREAPNSLGLDSNTLELRRCIFWAAYCIDREICSALQRPLSIPDATINVLEPQQLQGEDQSIFIGSIQYCQLLSEIVHVHFEGGELPDNVSWDEWLGRMEDKLIGWHAMQHRSAQSCQSAEFSLARGMMILHRPSPRMPMPSDRSLLRAFEHATTSARLHRDHIHSSSLRRPWLSAHYTLEAATITLFCLRNGCASIRAKFGPAQILDMAKLFTANFIAIAEQDWPVVLNYAGAYERLLGTLLDGVFSTPCGDMNKFSPAHEAELLRLLYPGPAQIEKLRFGHAPRDEILPVRFDLLDMDFDILEPTMSELSGLDPSVLEPSVLEPSVLDPDDSCATWDIASLGFAPREIGMGLPVGFQW